MNLFGTPPDDLCGVCGKPIADGEAIYAIPDKDGRVRHYACWEKVNPMKNLREAMESFDRTIAKVRSMAKSLRERAAEEEKKR